MKSNKIKIINDPVHGIIRFKHEILYDIIDHPYVQRLRRIKQMGFSSLVYPGANHSRFEHVLGALFLMTKALDLLRDKGVKISEDEYVATCIAILCHDLGHGPFSHALEYQLLPMSHEDISLYLMKDLETEFGDPFDLAIDIFTDKYPRKFLCQLVSSQLDIDRLDYLTRDSFYSGVVEGKVGYDRLIMMMNVVDDMLVIEEKGVSSIEKFLLSRHMMYTQVYLHKASLAAEQMLQLLIKRSVKLILEKKNVVSDENFKSLILSSHRISNNSYESIIQTFVEIDDVSIYFLIKSNTENSDPLLKLLSNSILKRKLFKVYLHSVVSTKSSTSEVKAKIGRILSLTKEDVDFLVVYFKEQSKIYAKDSDPILILTKEGEVKEFSTIVDIVPMRCSDTEHYILLPKELKI